MLVVEYIQLIVFLIVLVLGAILLGKGITKVIVGTVPSSFQWLYALESRILALSKAPHQSMTASEYAWAVIQFNMAGIIVVLLILMLQHLLPLNPQNLPGLRWDLALNTAVSFVTNTNWQSYSGESTLSYGSQMLALGVQNFVSAGTGIAVLVALQRGLSQSRTTTIGNFWSDLTRIVLFILLPLSILWAVLLMGQGVVQTFQSSVVAHPLEGGQQVIPLGPAASQIAIKQLGSNGGGFFGVNSAFPLENPTPFSNFLQMLGIIMLPSALTIGYGHFIKKPREGYVLFAVMAGIFLVGLAIMLWAEYGHNPALGITASLEGKEVRFGIMNSTLWGSITTITSNGSVNSMHDSFSPLGGMILLLNMMFGEVIFGGVGSGLYGMIIFVILTVFIAGLMVGRTPEYLGKKIETLEVKMAMLAILAPNAVLILLSALSAVLPLGTATIGNQGPHGLTEILYAFASAANNNGSAFAGLGTNNIWYNTMLTIAMLAGRYGVILPVVVIAGSMAQKQSAEATIGSFRTDTMLFGLLLTGVIVIVGALTYFPALALGPIIEHLLMNAGRLF